MQSNPTIANTMLAEAFSVRPILFSTKMVTAIREGRKTQTRRIIKSRHESGLFQVCRRVIDGQITDINSLDWDERNCEKDITCPYGNIGDVLWVRETWFNDADFGEKPIYVYKEDNENFPRGSSPWKPSIFMPKGACRLFLKITDIRVERLQDISEEDAAAEGVFIHPVYPSPRMEFASLWDKINSQNNWNSNPFVWAISFELTERPQGFC